VQLTSAAGAATIAFELQNPSVDGGTLESAYVRLTATDQNRQVLARS
jgi:hypothetical protein